MWNRLNRITAPMVLATAFAVSAVQADEFTDAEHRAYFCTHEAKRRNYADYRDTSLIVGIAGYRKGVNMLFDNQIQIAEEILTRAEDQIVKKLDEAKKGYSVGANDCVIKPVEKRVLAEKIARIFS